MNILPVARDLLMRPLSAIMNTARHVINPKNLFARTCGAGVLLAGLTVFWTHGRSDADRFAVVRVSDGRIWNVAIADTPERRAKGLAHRPSLQGDGLLIVFPSGSRPAIWMRGMEFPLDLVWVDEQGRVLLVLPDVPPCRGDNCPVYEPLTERATRYVLELPAGRAAQAGITPGARLKLIFR